MENWEREFFRLAAWVLYCRMQIEPNAFGCLQGELDYGAEMHLLLKESRMLPAQRLGRCATGLFRGKSTTLVPLRIAR